MTASIQPRTQTPSDLFSPRFYHCRHLQWLIRRNHARPPEPSSRNFSWLECYCSTLGRTPTSTNASSDLGRLPPPTALFLHLQSEPLCQRRRRRWCPDCRRLKRTEFHAAATTKWQWQEEAKSRSGQEETSRSSPSRSQHRTTSKPKARQGHHGWRGRPRARLHLHPLCHLRG